MSGGGRGREPERVVVCSDGMAHGVARAVCREAGALWDGAGTKADTDRKSVYMCQKYYWFDKIMQILLMHNLKHAAIVKILLSGLSFWEKERKGFGMAMIRISVDGRGSARFIQHLLRSHPIPNVFFCQP